MHLVFEPHKVESVVLDVRKIPELRKQFPPTQISLEFQHRDPETRKFSFAFLGVFLFSIALIIAVYSYGNANPSLHVLPIEEAAAAPPGSDSGEVNETSSLETESSACPNCTPSTQSTTRILDPVVDNPVSFINEKHQTGAKYSNEPQCNNPPVFRIILTIEHQDGSWEGKGAKKADAKKHAAYKAMKDLYPEDLDEVICDPIPCGDIPDPECADVNLDF